MKSREIIVELKLDTDISREYLRNIGRWQHAINSDYEKTQIPIYGICKVKSVKIKK